MRVYTRNLENAKHQPVMNELVMEVESVLDETMFNLLTRELLHVDTSLVISAIQNTDQKKQIAFRLNSGGVNW